MTVLGPCFRKITQAALKNMGKNIKKRVILQKQEKIIQMLKLERWEHTYVKEESRYTFCSRLESAREVSPLLAQPQGEGRRGGKMCAEGHRHLGSQVVWFQSPCLYLSRPLITLTCPPHTHTCTYACMLYVCMHAGTI